MSKRGALRDRDWHARTDLNLTRGGTHSNEQKSIWGRDFLRALAAFFGPKAGAIIALIKIGVKLRLSELQKRSSRENFLASAQQFRALREPVKACDLRCFAAAIP